MAKKKETVSTEDTFEIQPIKTEPLIVELPIDTPIIEDMESNFYITSTTGLEHSVIQKSETEYYVTADIKFGEDIDLTNSNEQSRKVTKGTTVNRIVINPHEAAHIRIAAKLEYDDSFIVRFELFERLKEKFYLVQNELDINDKLIIENISDIPQTISDQELVAILKFIKVN